jgi:hypothetical protein
MSARCAWCILVLAVFLAYQHYWNIVKHWLCNLLLLKKTVATQLIRHLRQPPLPRGRCTTSCKWHSVEKSVLPCPAPEAKWSSQETSQNWSAETPASAGIENAQRLFLRDLNQLPSSHLDCFENLGMVQAQALINPWLTSQCRVKWTTFCLQTSPRNGCPNHDRRSALLLETKP